MYKVYKVETIGDAYMVVSGLPTEISDHAAQIAKLSLQLSRSAGHFVIKHLPNEKLQLRIGIHTGTWDLFTRAQAGAYCWLFRTGKMNKNECAE